eukprot:scaffold973_cov399-Prasinococcus_capsulatus_cf.AAC.28
MHRSKEDAAGVAQYSEPEYPVHVVVGSAGARMRGEADWWADEIDLYIEDYTEQVASQRADCCLECLSAAKWEFGFLKLDTTNSEKLRGTFIASRLDGYYELDSFVIIQNIDNVLGSHNKLVKNPACTIFCPHSVGQNVDAMAPILPEGEIAINEGVLLMLLVGCFVCFLSLLSLAVFFIYKALRSAPKDSTETKQLRGPHGIDEQRFRRLSSSARHHKLEDLTPNDEMQ